MRLLLPAIGALVLALTPATALAGTVTGDFNSFTYTDVPGNQTNDVVVTRSAGDLVFTDPAGAVDNSTECDQTSPNVVTCPGDDDEFFYVNASLEGGDDDADGSAASDTEFTINGGAGDDELTGGAEDDNLSGGLDDDTLIGNGDRDYLYGDEGIDGLRGGPGDDYLSGGEANDDLQGWDDDDDLTGGDGADTLSGGPSSPDGCGDEANFGDKSGALRITLDGVANDDTTDGDTLLGDIESLGGGEGGDTFVGSEGTNCFRGRDGNDSLDTLGGQDQLEGGDDTDTMLGGAGEDWLADNYSNDGPAPDVWSGGDGIDTASLTAASCDEGCNPRDINVTLDDQPNDGAPGEGDNVRADIEDVEVGGSFGDLMVLRGLAGGSFDQVAGRVSLTGGPGYNVLSSASGDDSIDPREGSDSVFAAAGADVINARDGFADRVNCGSGSDTANVDQLDVLLACEVVNTESVPVALEDRPPGVTLDAPTTATLSPDAPTVLRATANDDKGIQRVLFMDDERVVCNDEAPPYECNYQPRGEDVGRDTLAAVALDAAQQAATATREVTVARFTPTALTIKRGGSRARPARVKASGVLRLPAALLKTLGCRGTVKIRVRSGGRTIATKKAKVTKTCRYSKRFVVRHAAATMRASFGGNAFVKKATSKSIKARRG